MKKMWSDLRIEELDVAMTMGGTNPDVSEEQVRVANLWGEKWVPGMKTVPAGVSDPEGKKLAKWMAAHS